MAQTDLHRHRPASALFSAALLVLVLLLTSGCGPSPELTAEEARLAERKDDLNLLKEAIKDLPRLQAQVVKAEAENKKLRARLKKRPR